MERQTGLSTEQQTGSTKKNFPWPKPSNGLLTEKKLPLSDLTKMKCLSSTCKPGVRCILKTINLNTQRQERKTPSSAFMWPRWPQARYSNWMQAQKKTSTYPESTGPRMPTSSHLSASIGFKISSTSCTPMRLQGLAS